ncbi:unnamed protein product [Pylaiella littoralis]
MRFTHQDEAVIGAFLSLLGPHIFASSMLQPKRKMHIKVSKVGDDEDLFPETHGVRMQTRQKSTGNLIHTLNADQSFEEDEENEDDEDYKEVTSLGSSVESTQKGVDSTDPC